MPGASSRPPTATHTPVVTERAWGIASVTTRMPLARVEMRGSGWSWHLGRSGRIGGRRNDTTPAPVTGRRGSRSDDDRRAISAGGRGHGRRHRRSPPLGLFSGPRSPNSSLSSSSKASSKDTNSVSPTVARTTSSDVASFLRRHGRDRRPTAVTATITASPRLASRPPRSRSRSRPPPLDDRRHRRSRRRRRARWPWTG